ncbi:hypothetical protein BT93_L1865 [Corymbia citriodora subsp. variegata]|uniref:F-box domain-containing protein n=1 Tax=Corymbia citriodora subsp. variegata TaxID=360336 RepID=A0A8T0CLG3_CORYI|nr:hypothetical protein BT93_L1865 [Corymbia citriodora subsp. variegata]
MTTTRRAAIKRLEPAPRPPSRAPSGPASSCRRPRLPEDIIIELLLRLPVKSLMRFKCVGKLWRSLISDPGFGKWHLERIIKTYPIVTIDCEGLDKDRAVIKFRNPRINDLTWKPIIVGSCYGLVCFNVMGGRFILYNPTTEELRKIPSSDLSLEGEIFRGFGCDPASDDYEVIVSEGSKICQVEIFSLKCGSWRKIQVQESRLPYEQGVYGRGPYTGARLTRGNNKKETVIMSFDLSEEIFHQMLPVPEWNGDIIFQGLNIHWDNLYTSNAYWFMAWIMNEHGRGGSWKKLFSFLTEGLPSYYLQIPIAYTRKGKILFLVDFFVVILFNPEDNTCKNTPIVSTRLAIYVEALVLPYMACQPSRF